ncbi:hypothetical protein BGT96224_3143, partial [Blumeria graminis f. sp. tritici 96224]
EKNQQWPSVEEIIAHPSFPDAIWKLTPSQKGNHAVAAGRGGPFNIDWEVHGSGDIKLVVCKTFLLRLKRHVDLIIGSGSWV